MLSRFTVSWCYLTNWLGRLMCVTYGKACQFCTTFTHFTCIIALIVVILQSAIVFLTQIAGTTGIFLGCY